MKKIRGVVAIVMAICLFVNGSMVANATDTSKKETKKEENQDNNKETEMTEEEKKAKEELDKAYAIPVESNAWENWPEADGTYGEAAIVMEVETGSILYAKNIDAKMFPASITKVLTALVAMENGDLKDPVTFSHDCVSFLQPGDSSVGLKEGNVIALEQTMYAMLLASANEAAYAVAENVGKNAGFDYDWFIGKMNQKVKDLGGTGSNFVNTNGLHDPEHYTCARDMALIGRAVFDYPEIFQIMQTLQYTIPKTDTVEEHVFQQKDKMLQPENENYYKYTIGGKTGFTSDAKSTLITMADNGKMQLVAVVLRTYGKNVYPDTTKLLKYAFKNFEKINISENETETEIKEYKDKGQVVVVPKGTAFADLQREIVIDTEAEKTAENYNEGMLRYTYAGQPVGSADVILTDEYLKSQGVKKVEEEKPVPKESKDTDTPKEKSRMKRILSFLKNKFLDMNPKEQGILVGAGILFMVLVIAFLGAWIHVKNVRRRKRKKAREYRKRS